MKRRMFETVLAVALSLLLNACSPESQRRDAIGDILGLRLSGGTEVLYEDTHGGFHGDGYTRAVYDFEEDLAEAIAENQGWTALPTTSGLIPLLNGSAGGPFERREGVPFFPQSKEGFYYFRDRHSEAVDDREEGRWDSRSSWNFTLAIYDKATCRLYYVAFDT